jgi:predicted secreted protein
MRRIRFLSVAAALLALLASATAAEYRKQPARPGNPTAKAAAQPKAPADRILVGPTDNGKTVTAVVGKTVELRLTGDRATGYDWQITGVTGDSLEAAGKPQFTPGPNIRGKLGGVFSFPYKAVRPGRTTIKAAFVRPGDKNPRPLHTYSIEVMVKKAE